MEIEYLEKILFKKPEMKLSKLEKEYLERHYRENVKKAAFIQMEEFKRNTRQFDYADEISERVEATAQLCIAANLIRLTETFEDVLNKMEQEKAR